MLRVKVSNNVLISSIYNSPLGEHAPESPSNAHGFAMRKMSLCDMQIPKSKKNIFAPPLPNPGYAPDAFIDLYLLDQITTKSIHLYTIEQNWGKSSLLLYVIGSRKGVGGHYNNQTLCNAGKVGTYLFVVT